MSPNQWTLAAATLAAALALWLMLPRGVSRGWRLGVVLGLASLGLYFSQVPRLVDWLDYGAVLILGGLTVISAAGTVTARNPVYSAVWFALVLLGTAGLFLVQGAQFLGVATIAVYAGAILVTFLFVLMLAAPAGQAHYDRVAWEALLSSTTGAVMMGMLAIVMLGAFRAEAEGMRAAAGAPAGEATESAAAEEAALQRQLAEQRRRELAGEIQRPDHVARFGGEMFSRHLISVQVAGVLLLAALVGAVAMVAHGRGPAEGGRRHA